MTQAFCALLLILPLTVGASPRFFVPATLRPGSVNETYAWDEEPVPPYTVEVFRPNEVKPLLKIQSFAVELTLSVFGREGHLLHWDAALVCPDALDGPGPVSVRFVDTTGTIFAEATSEILPRSFPVEEIVLNQAMTVLRAKPDVRKDREAAAIWNAYRKFEPQFAWNGGKFFLPVSNTVRHSAEFGDTRLYKYTDGTTSRDYHRGTDFAVPVGTPVLVTAGGTVVLVANRMLTGRSVVVEHAPGVYSDYFHLSQTLVQVGQKVSAGDRIALSGATGLVTGPHLHWEVRCGGVSVDPFDLVDHGLLDMERVSAVVSSIERSTH